MQQISDESGMTINFEYPDLMSHGFPLVYVVVRDTWFREHSRTRIETRQVYDTSNRRVGSLGVVAVARLCIG